MFRKTKVYMFSLFLLVSLSGCASCGKKDDLQSQGLRNQVSLLEAQVQSKDEEINTLRTELETTKTKIPAVTGPAGTGEVTKKKVIPEVKSRPNIKQIQIALSNAGYNPGTTDGKMGKQTKEAIRAFQRANNLPVNGKVGKKTWELLKEYLYKKVK